MGNFETEQDINERIDQRYKSLLKTAKQTINFLAKNADVDEKEIVVDEARMRKATEGYFKLLDSYKSGHRYNGKLVAPAKIAAFTVAVIIANKPIVSHTGRIESTEAALANQWFAWRCVCNILRLNLKIIPDKIEDIIIYNIHHGLFVKKDGLNEIWINGVTTWVVTFMHLLHTIYGSQSNIFAKFIQLMFCKTSQATSGRHINQLPLKKDSP
jgi:hypothetical protein